jgi:hypothetical protein
MKKYLSLILLTFAGVAGAAEYLYQSGIQEMIAAAQTRSYPRGVEIGIISTGITVDHEDLAVPYFAKHFYHGGGSYDTNDISDSECNGTWLAGPIIADANGIGVRGIFRDSQSSNEVSRKPIWIARVNQLDSEFIAAVDWMSGHCDIIVTDYPIAQGVLAELAAADEWTLFIATASASITNVPVAANVLVVSACDTNGTQCGEDAAEVFVRVDGTKTTHCVGGYYDVDCDDEYGAGNDVAAGIITGAAARLFLVYPTPIFLKHVLVNGVSGTPPAEFNALKALEWAGNPSYRTITTTNFTCYGLTNLETVAEQQLGSNWRKLLEYSSPNAVREFRVIPVTESK